jgi:hypothetical protein
MRGSDFREVQAIFCRRRRQPIKPSIASNPGRPAPTR